MIVGCCGVMMMADRCRGSRSCRERACAAVAMMTDAVWVGLGLLGSGLGARYWISVIGGGDFGGLTTASEVAEDAAAVVCCGGACANHVCGTCLIGLCCDGIGGGWTGCGFG